MKDEKELAKVVNGSWCISKEQLDYFVSLEKENKRLKNNWNELKEWLQGKRFVYNITGEDLDEDTSITEVLFKMKELEEKEVE